MTLTQDQIDQYWSKGYLVVNGVFSRDEADAMAKAAGEQADKELAESTSAEASFTTDVSASGERMPRKVDTPFEKGEQFRQFASNAKLRVVLSQLLDGQPMLLVDQLFMKPPRFGSAKPYHQDNAYFKIEPQEKVITAWIALDDVDEENGCLRYIAGSQEGPIVPHIPVKGQEHNLEPDPAYIDLGKEELGEVQKGGVIFHHGKTLHTSHRNESDRWRRAYATHWVTPEVSSGAGMLENAYFRKPEYAKYFEPVEANV